ncbi:MAG: hypothetical protein KJO44_10925 [Gemmatimonadetes bacterium]|nr:hypothetical protein [Gemmatimonadota bacterium]MBT8479813.1 hypothetical protein [Gemmatimonadota bacterium]NNK49898.1 hypothetical protein [Gemmatimonadota bacterium]
MSPFAPDEGSRVRFASRWIRLGDPAPSALTDARLQLHWAIQLLAAFGEAFLPHRPDGSHSAVSWSPERRAFLSGETLDGSSIRLGLQPGGFAYRLFGPGAAQSEPFELEGRTLAEAAVWLESELVSRIGPGGHAFNPPSPDIAGHRVGRGAPFDAALPDLAELERWFHDAALLLEAVELAEDGASRVRCWPHHFDIAVLIDLDHDADPPVGPEESRSVGIGMTPGDDSYAEPYFYVSPWPYPEPVKLPKLPPPARWHTVEWVGAVLTADDLVAAGDEKAQATRAASFARAAIAGSRALLRR